MDKKEFVDRGALLSELCGDDPSRMEDYYYNAIKNAPAADVVPVVHGHWCINEYEYFTCSECGESYYNGAYTKNEAKEMLANGQYYPHCPYCMAKMDGGKEE